MSTERTVLILIDIQKGFLDISYWGSARSNPDFEDNAVRLLETYRSLVSLNPSSHLLIHVAHSSRTATSPLHPTSPGFAFQDFAQPLEDEMVITNEVNSAFIGTDLESVIRGHLGDQGGIVYLAGLTTDHCVSTTTRMAANLGVAGDKGEVVFVGDATACWKKESGGYDAETVHGVHVESLREFAVIGKTEDLLEKWNGWTKTKAEAV